eukprot:TRINITY_DN5324_c0_g1_i1.p1 TRINITY_DN5324_c0_g1~~TRINITY_DN5324_c0_g1_i1.p1  ORF type:complete len:476 (+),score=99.92 TRINITY_DN5324_c0_g1_i1:196-1623(+)
MGPGSTGGDMEDFSPIESAPFAGFEKIFESKNVQIYFWQLVAKVPSSVLAHQESRVLALSSRNCMLLTTKGHVSRFARVEDIHTLVQRREKTGVLRVIIKFREDIHEPSWHLKFPERSHNHQSHRSLPAVVGFLLRRRGLPVPQLVQLPPDAPIDPVAHGPFKKAHGYVPPWKREWVLQANARGNSSAPGQHSARAAAPACMPTPPPHPPVQTAPLPFDEGDQVDFEGIHGLVLDAAQDCVLVSFPMPLGVRTFSPGDLCPVPRTLSREDVCLLVTVHAAHPDDLLGVEYCDLIVTTLRSGGLGHRSGVELGRRLVAVDGVPVKTVQDAVTATEAVTSPSFRLLFSEVLGEVTVTTPSRYSSRELERALEVTRQALKEVYSRLTHTLSERDTAIELTKELQATLGELESAERQHAQIQGQPQPAKRDTPLVDRLVPIHLDSPRAETHSSQTTLNEYVLTEVGGSDAVSNIPVLYL